MTVSIKVGGLKELESQLSRLKKSTGKAALRRGLIKAAEPMAELMRQYAPDDPRTANEDLNSSITVSTQLSPRQKNIHRRMFKDDRAAVEVFVGPGSVRHATFQEFGTRHHGAQPYARPAFEADREELLSRLKSELAAEIDKAIGRAAKRGTLLG